MRAAADSSRILAAFTPLQQRFAGFPPALVAQTVALLVLPAAQVGGSFRNFANFKDFCNFSLSTFAV
jgi:hypothetical protein